ncbi:MAG: MarR family winged helix-turn-helix transcriptional regulator [bacterium]
MEEKQNKVEVISQLICSLTRLCSIKEDYFASSFNLSPTEVKMLRLFSYAPSYTIKELKEKMKLTSGRITHIISSLENKKLISRIPNENDKRNITVTVLPKAAPLLNNLISSYNQLHCEILQNLKKEDLNQITDSLNTLVSVFNKWVVQKEF